MAETEDLIKHLADEKPNEFAQTFVDRIRDVISGKVAERKVEIAKSLFEPKQQEEPEETVDTGETGEPEEQETDAAS